VTDTSPVIAIKLNVEKRQQCQRLAERLQLSLVSDSEVDGYPYLLEYQEEGLCLQQTGAKAAGPVLVDFSGGTAAHRRQQGGGELIVKAVAGNKQQRPTVLDATAGLGRDSFVLASWGYPVTLCERSNIIAALLDDGLQRARQMDDPPLQTIMQRMDFKALDAVDYLQAAGENSPPDVIVIDPMFPSSKKSALVKKEMQAFHYIVGADQDSAQLLDLALATATHRVVVKRPKKAEYLAGKKPNFAVEGKAIRFDIYSLRAFSK